MRGEMGINHQESFVALTTGAKMLSAVLNISIGKSLWADIHKPAYKLLMIICKNI